MAEQSTGAPFELEKLINDLVKKQLAQDVQIKMLSLCLRTFLKVHIGEEAAKAFWENYTRLVKQETELSYQDNPFVNRELNSRILEQLKDIPGINFSGE